METLDRWARAAALAEPRVRGAAIWAIREAARANGVVPASIHGLYAARGRGEWDGRTVPAMNLRGWTYPTCRAAFRAARKLQADLLIFEQAPMEMIYADQRPAEYTAGVLAAALREGHRGPIFLQGDHVQVNAGAYAKDPAAEIRRLTDLIREQVAAGYYNIDADASTVVDLSHPTLVEQQRLNAELTARFTRIIREMEPAGVTISVGAKIGEVGAHNTTPDELRAFMATYFDHPRLPEPVKQAIQSYVFTHHASEKKPGQTDAQFVYSTRKKAWAGMKARFWDLPADVQDAIGASLEEMFTQMFERLNAGGTRDLVAWFTQAPVVPVPVPPALAAEPAR